jgi:hypothetical protein
MHCQPKTLLTCTQLIILNVEIRYVMQGTRYRLLLCCMLSNTKSLHVDISVLVTVLRTIFLTVHLLSFTTMLHLPQE